MFFEDEKDIIKEGADIHIDEDGTVTWEDVLNDEEDIQVPDEASQVPQQEMPVEDVLLGEQEEEINDGELMEILNQTEVPQSEPTTSEEEDFDIDAQLANVVLEQNNSQQDDTIPRKSEKKRTSSSSPLLLAVLFGLLVVVGIYYGMQYIQNMSSVIQATKNELNTPPSVQQDMNNMTPEELGQRQVQEEGIPVVNEEEANEIKPLAEEEQSEKLQEKKQVINVIPTGRANPFMPISKYAKTSIPEAHLLYDKTGIPKPPETYGIKEEETVQLMTIAVSGIMYDEVKPSAIITYNDNDYFVQKGDRLDNYRIVDISRNYVMIALGKNVYRANIGEEFKISSKFDGSAQFLPQKQGGGRQYYSVSDRTGGSSGYSESTDVRYVSEDDIKINAK